MAVIRGEVWRADLSPARGTEPAGVRPVLVVQTDRVNPHNPHTIFVPFTTRIRHKLLPSHVLVPAGEGFLTQDSVAWCEQIRGAIAPVIAQSPARLAPDPALSAPPEVSVELPSLGDLGPRRAFAPSLAA